MSYISVLLTIGWGKFSLILNEDYMKEINDSIVIKSAETYEELCGRGYVHCTAWQEAYRGIV